MLSSISSPNNVKHLDSVYHTLFKDGRIKGIRGKLVLYKSHFYQEKYDALIIVPVDLR